MHKVSIIAFLTVVQPIASQQIWDIVCVIELWF